MLHSFSATEDYIEVRTLHGFAQQQFRMVAITALEHERTVLMAKVVANEVVDTILNWMLEGWCVCLPPSLPRFIRCFVRRE